MYVNRLIKIVSMEVNNGNEGSLKLKRLTSTFFLINSSILDYIVFQIFSRYYLYKSLYIYVYVYVA